MQIRSVLLAAAATSAVGSSIVVSGRLTDYPVFTGQALRYGLAALVLLALARLTGRGLSPCRGGTESGWDCSPPQA